MKRFLLISFALALGGCGSYEKDVEVICTSPSKAGITPSMDPSETAVAMARVISKNVKTQKAKDLLHSVAAMPGDEKYKLLRGEAQKAGLSKCEFADVLENMGGPK